MVKLYSNESLQYFFNELNEGETAKFEYELISDSELVNEQLELEDLVNLIKADFINSCPQQ